MANPYSTPAMPTAPMPVVRPILWLACLPQFLILGAVIAIGWFATRSLEGVVLGALSYLVYSYGSRAVLLRAHRRGMRLSGNLHYEAAIEAFQDSYAFLSRHPWIDRFRSITMLTPAAMCYREMALINIAAAYGQLGDGAAAKLYYQRAAAEFPSSTMARNALTFIDSVERAQALSSNSR
jgi:tetratricopeptide (TPR) repeat protein